MHPDTAPEVSGHFVWSPAFTRFGEGFGSNRLKAELQTGAVSRCARRIGKQKRPPLRAALNWIRIQLFPAAEDQQRSNTQTGQRDR